MSRRKEIPPYIERGIAVFLLLLLGIGVGSLFTKIHRYQERIEQLEEGLASAHSRIDQLQDVLYSDSAPAPAQKNTAANHTKRRFPSTDNSQKKPLSEGVLPETKEDRPGRKYTEPRLFDLNHIDSLTLIRIPGIAAKTASTILRNRERYGGFYDPWQLRDFLTWEAAEAHMEEWCTQWFSASINDIRHIHINRISEEELRHHPYVTYKQAAEIVHYRTRNKEIHTIEEIANLPAFQGSDLSRLMPYLQFD